MADLEDGLDLYRPVLICAFAGWNDAGDAATAALDHLILEWDAVEVGSFDSDDFYDFQVTRPFIRTDERGMRQLSWPGTEILHASGAVDDRDILLMRGIEPSMRWRRFSEEVLLLIEEHSIELVILLGALLSDTPHTRSVPVSGSATTQQWAERMEWEPSSYEGPTGLVGVLMDACATFAIPAVSLWAGGPHYLPRGPNYKAALALVNHIEDVLDTRIEQTELREDAAAWQRGADEVAEEDEEIAAYVDMYERDHDAASLPEASGEAIAAEFERYLKRRNRES